MPTTTEIRDAGQRLADELQRLADDTTAPAKYRRRAKAALRRDLPTLAVKTTGPDVPTEKLAALRDAGKSLAEIAAECGISKQAVWIRLRRQSAKQA